MTTIASGIRPAPGVVLDPQGYMDLLVERQNAHMAEHPPTLPWLVPLLEWFIQPGDEDLVDMDAIEASNARSSDSPKPERTPRVYRTSESLREERDRLIAQRAPLAEPISPDRAASGGVALGAKRTARLQTREDSRLRRYVALTRRIETLDHRIRSADARERRAAAREQDAS